MTLNDYEAEIDKIIDSSLTRAAKGQALGMLASEMTGAVWQPHAKPRAQAIAAKAQEESAAHGGLSLEGMDELVARGYVAPKL